MRSADASAAMVTTTGIGLRQPHLAALLAAPPRLGFVEVHAENYFADGGAAPAALQAVRARWPVSLHGVGLGLGSAAGVDVVHLQRLATLVQQTEPLLVSDHACFARAPRRHGGPLVHANDLLPLAFTPAALDILVANVQQVQESLRRPLLVENLSSYVQWADDAMPETRFLNELTRRSGCGLLLDVNNLVVNALNADAAWPLPPGGRDTAAAVRAACAWIDAIDAASVGEIHLAGFDASGELVIDDHGSRVHEPVWQVLRHAARRLGRRPTLVEWDTALPALEVLLAEAAQAERCWADADADADAAAAGRAGSATSAALR